MKTIIYELKENGDGNINKIAEYTLHPKDALVCFIMQSRKNFNTWDYPKEIKGMRESNTTPNHWYFDDDVNERVLAAYPA